MAMGRPYRLRMGTPHAYVCAKKYFLSSLTYSMELFFYFNFTTPLYEKTVHRIHLPSEFHFYNAKSPRKMAVAYGKTNRRTGRNNKGSVFCQLDTEP